MTRPSLLRIINIDYQSIAVTISIAVASIMTFIIPAFFSITGTTPFQNGDVLRNKIRSVDENSKNKFSEY